MSQGRSLSQEHITSQNQDNSPFAPINVYARSHYWENKINFLNLISASDRLTTPPSQVLNSINKRVKSENKPRIVTITRAQRFVSFENLIRIRSDNASQSGTVRNQSRRVRGQILKIGYAVIRRFVKRLPRNIQKRVRRRHNLSFRSLVHVLRSII